MATTVESTLTPVIFNFDIFQGQDRNFSLLYVEENVADSMTDADLEMDVMPMDFSDPIDVLTTDNGRLTITGTDTFSMSIPGITTLTYPVQAVQTQFVYRVWRTNPNGRDQLFQGTITVKR